MPKWETILIAVIVNTVLLFLLFKIINIFERKIKDKIRLEESNSPLLRFMPFFMKVIKAVILFVAITDFLQSQGYSVSSILAGFGIGGIAVGMAAKDALANIFGSVELLTDHLYKIGDYVKINGIEGFVEDISIRSTKIRDLDNFQIIIPNNTVANAIVTNVSRAKKRLLHLNFGITYSMPNEKIKKAQEILRTIALSHKEIHNNFLVAIHDLGDSSINIRFRGYIKSGSYEKFFRIRGEYCAEVIEKFRDNEIEFAFPTQSVYIESNDEN